MLLDKMKFRVRFPRWLLGILLLGLLGGGSYLAYRQITATQNQESERQVQTVTAKRIDAPVTITANGLVQPERSINVSPKNSGVLKELLVQEGDTVREGQILAYMDASNLEGQITQAQGQLDSAQANLQKLLAGNRQQDIAQAQSRVTELEASLRQAEQTLQENQQLQSQGAISRRDLNNTLAERDRVQAQVAQSRQLLSLQQAGARPEDIAAAEAEVTRATGQLQTIQAQVNDTIIRAPFSGIVTRKYADPGSFVTPTTAGSSVSSATSSSILALASRNQVVAKVPETNIPRIKVGQRVKIQLEAYPDENFRGQVTQVATQSTVEQNVTNFEVKMSVNDPKRLLKAGMNVNVQFEVGTLNNALVIPTVAIVRQERGTGVYVPSKEGKGRSQFQPITTGATIGRQTVIVSGLNEGDPVLVSFPKGERPPGRTPSVIPGMRSGPQGPAAGGGEGSGRRRQREGQ